LVVDEIVTPGDKGLKKKAFEIAAIPEAEREAT